MHAEYLIVGNSAGAVGAVEAIRTVDVSGSIVVISDESYPVYSRPLISKYLAGEKSRAQMLYREPDFYARWGVRLYSDREVRRIDPVERLARLDDGLALRWDRLLLATGGKPIVPSVGGLNKEGVFTFTTLDDAVRLDRFLDDKRRAVVVGGGLIGISVTEALWRRGIDVTVVELKDSLLNTILDETASGMVARALDGVGIAARTGRSVVEVLGNGRVEGVRLDNGDELPVDLVVLAVGVVPRAELAVESGIRVNRGIAVDTFMGTSCAGVYACGDVAEAYDLVYREARLTPVWPNAYLGGRVAGLNMAGHRAQYTGTVVNSLNYFGIDIASAGMAEAPSNHGYETLWLQEKGDYRKVVLRNSLVVGMICVGNIEVSGIIFGLMRKEVPVDSFKEQLVSPGFGLASLPRDIWEGDFRRPVGVAQQPVAADQPEGESVSAE
ncbi:MAG: NAD(P)/FAD-dependent oxidoreductase [Chloroflexota bacterium]